MKPKSKSKTLWSAGTVTALGAFLLYIQQAPAGTFPAWVPYLAGGVVTILGPMIFAFKVQDRKAQATAKRTAADMLADQRGRS